MTGGAVNKQSGSVAAYEKYMGRWSAKLGYSFAHFASLKAGGKFLDVGCGTGSLIEAIQNTVRDSSICGIDPVPGFVDYCRARFQSGRVQVDRGSAHNLPYADGSFDGALSLLVLMLITEPENVVAEMRRVTKREGTVAACTWDGVGPEMISIIWDELVKLDPASEARAERIKHYNGKGQLAGLWRATGLADVEETVIDMRTEFESFDDYWLPFMAGIGPTGRCLAALPEGLRDALKSALQKRLLPSGSDGPISLSARAWAVRGTA